MANRDIRWRFGAHWHWLALDSVRENPAQTLSVAYRNWYLLGDAQATVAVSAGAAGAAIASTQTLSAALTPAASAPTLLASASETHAATLDVGAAAPTLALSDSETFTAEIALSASAAGSSLASVETMCADVGCAAAAAALDIQSSQTPPPANAVIDIDAEFASLVSAANETFEAAVAIVCEAASGAVTAAETFTLDIAVDHPPAASGTVAAVGVTGEAAGVDIEAAVAGAPVPLPSISYAGELFVPETTTIAIRADLDLVAAAAGVHIEAVVDPVYLFALFDLDEDLYAAVAA